MRALDTLYSVPLALLVFAVPASAQRRVSRAEPGAPTHRFELTPMVGYLMSFSLGSPLGDVDIDDDISYGGVLSVAAGGGRFGELSYGYHGSQARLTNRPGLAPDSILTRLSTHYIQFGGVQEAHAGPTRPYLLGSLGLTVFDPDRAAHGSSTRFALSVGGGLKGFASNGRIGLRAQGRFYFNFIDGSFAAVCGPAGCGGGISGTAQVQFEGSGGVIFAF